MATARRHFALCTKDGMLNAIGGTDAGKSLLASVERYYPSTDSWSAAPPLPQARAGLCAVAVSDGMYVMGGMKYLMVVCIL
jgi:hypothetical protein